MYKEIFAAVLLSIATWPALADEEGVLIPDVPGISDSEGVLNLVGQAFVGRSWKVKTKDHQSVTAELEGITLRISISGTSLRYWDNADPTPRAVGPVSQQRPGTKETLATRWRANLKKDLEVLFAKRQFQIVPAESGAAPSQAATSIAERLKTLESLKNSAAITEAEYAKKRAEILDSL